MTLIAERVENIPTEKNEFKYIATAIQCAPQPHGIINRQPLNLYELHKFLLEAGIDLLSILRKRLLEFKDNGKYNLLKANLVLIVEMPKTRKVGEAPEATDIWAFVISNSIEEIGIEIGIWTIFEGKFSLLLPHDLSKKGETIKIQILNPINSLSRELASRINGFPQIEKKKILLIGGGALGSQVFMNLVRMGFGEWTIVDDDCLLPHNLARHALIDYFLGYPKAEMLAYQANNIIKGEKIAHAIVADVLSHSNLSNQLETAFNGTQLIIDASTSIPVARHIARDINSPARRISIFLSPSGRDVIMLAEDENRSIALDCLEMQYYRCLINEPTLENHLKLNDSSIRYARSCRDISTIIPQDIVALHSDICGRGIRNLLSNASASISIWETNLNDISVKHKHYSACKAFENKFGDWTLYCDRWFLDKIFQARTERLPNETGGVLVGSFDMQRKIIYVMDTVLSPPDSKEWPTVYIRGCKGLKSKIDKIKETTLGMLDYVGEWHSHPVGCSTEPGDDDCKAFSWLVDTMDVYGIPALMLIAGEQRHSWYLCRMK